MRELRWAVGVTTCTERLGTYLPITLNSLKNAGFTTVRLFLDSTYGNEILPNPDIAIRHPPLGPFSNWYLSLLELFLRNPKSIDRYAIFQDDILCSRNLRQYLNTEMPGRKSWLNLMTFMDNEATIQKKPIGWYEAPYVENSNGQPTNVQTGRSACGLVFTREAVMTLLTSHHLVMKPINISHPNDKIDGIVVTALNEAGFKEYIHNPSLITHIGIDSSMGNTVLWAGTDRDGHRPSIPPIPPPRTFRGEDFDLLTLRSQS
jgi:hypothetical protein